jgi:hypothetical protein
MRPLNPQERKRMTGLIEQLGADNSRIRSGAKENLRAFGARALFILKVHQKSEDPEIRFNCKALIQQIEDSEEQSPAGVM